MPQNKIKIGHHRIPVNKTEEVHVIEIFREAHNPQPTILHIHGTGGLGRKDRRSRLRLVLLC